MFVSVISEGTRVRTYIRLHTRLNNTRPTKQLLQLCDVFIPNCYNFCFGNFGKVTFVVTLNLLGRSIAHKRFRKKVLLN